MALQPAEAKWLYRFTGGAIPLPDDQKPKTGLEALAAELELRQARERIEEQALKDALIAQAIAAIEPEKERIRAACDLEATTAEEPGGKEKTQRVRDKDGRQERAFDSMEAPKMTRAATGRKDKKLTATDATQAMALVVQESDRLAAELVQRSYIDEVKGVIATKSAKLFTNDEIMNDLYTPLVRQLVLPETFVPDKFSATQKMIDGSNDYYIKECKEKGKQLGYGLPALAKGTVQLATAVTGTVLGALAPVKDPQIGMSSSGTLTKGGVAKAQAITEGIAALLTVSIDVIDQVDDFRKTEDFSVAGYKAVMNGIATGIGKIVAGTTGDMNLGLVITDSIVAASTASTLVPQFYNWRAKGGEPPVGAIIEAIGDAIGASFSATSDQTSGNTSTAFAQASAGVSAAFSTFAMAAQKKLIEAMRKGDWKTVFSVLEAAGNNAAKAVPVCVRFAAEYNAISEDPSITDPEKRKEELFAAQAKELKAMNDTTTNVDKAGGATTKLTDTAIAEISKKLGLKLPSTPMGKLLEDSEQKFKEREEKNKEDAAAAQQEEIAAIQKALDAERKAYKESLSCLGSKDPSAAEYKSIARLVAQLERDRAIWTAVHAMVGAGIGIGTSVTTVTANVAAEVLPALKVAGQMMKFIFNVEAAATRLAAFLEWRDGQKDAESAVSPYATSIDNFVRNQGEQFSHYSLQAAANLIQALLAAGEMSPYAPAFKAAGGAVAAAAAAEDMLYKFYKAVALRRAWSQTKEVLDPKNKGNRKMALLVRQINPTLAKYSIAYGALISKDPIAITAMNRIGLDRETLTRAGDKVADVKGYLEKLYNEDNIVVGQLDATPGKTKVPAPALTSKAWSLSHLLWTEKEGLATPNPPGIIGNLALVEPLLKRERETLAEAEFEQLLDALMKLEAGFRSFKPATESSAPLDDVRKAAGVYADLAAMTAKAVRLDFEAKQAQEAEKLVEDEEKDEELV
ncbi:hypothetical protein [Siccirubricoccus phaeus]|uniref:hypothetical protein n=1 Tax=Siccirubricoccus phaeus TaxID=2595053 RepID=UPI0011F3B85D|nr:hypothetical protein [Siccirubricoccus phaeus]